MIVKIDCQKLRNIIADAFWAGRLSAQHMAYYPIQEQHMVTALNKIKEGSKELSIQAIRMATVIRLLGKNSAAVKFIRNGSSALSEVTLEEIETTDDLAKGEKLAIRYTYDEYGWD